MHHPDPVPSRVADPRRPRRHRPMVSLGIILALACSAPVLASDPDPATIGPTELCLTFDTSRLDAGRIDAVVAGLADAIAARPLVFPAPVIDRTQAGTAVTIGVRDTDAGVTPVTAGAPAPCLVEGADWSLAVSQRLLALSAVRILASAGLPENVSTEILVDFSADADLVRTTLRFSGDWGVGGTCWVDDRLTVDPATGLAIASDELHQDLNPFAPQDACTRFRAFMPDGGAGRMALQFAPGAPTVSAAGAGFTVEATDVRADTIVLSGTFESP